MAKEETPKKERGLQKKPEKVPFSVLGWVKPECPALAYLGASPRGGGTVTLTSTLTSTLTEGHACPDLTREAEVPSGPPQGVNLGVNCVWRAPSSWVGFGYDLGAIWLRFTQDLSRI